MNNILKIARAILLMATGLIIFSCNESNKISIPNVDDIALRDIQFVRYDRIVNDLDANEIEKEYLKTVRKYPKFTDLYFKKLLGFENYSNDSFYNAISQFVLAPEIRGLQDTIEQEYEESSALEEEFSKAFKFLQYYFPDYRIPDVYFFQSEFGYQTILFSDMEGDGVGVGLDMFLADVIDYKNIDPTNPSFSDYLTRTYNADHVVRKTMDMILDDVMGQPSGKRFIDLILHQGKKTYLLKRILPYSHDTIVTEFSLDQLEWLNNNELEMWSFFLEKELMYETSFLKIDKYIYPSPNSPGMPMEAPGRTGSFIGWKIIESYMDKHPEMSIENLLQAFDSQNLLEKSKYKPKRR